MTIQSHAPRLAALLHKHPNDEALIVHLRRVLHELWLTEYVWQSIEVFAPIYDLMCAMMALHGLTFARYKDQLQIIISEDEGSASGIQDVLSKWVSS